MNLPHAIELLERVRQRLDADTLRGEWSTADGTVAVIVPGPRILVDEEEVPMQRESA